MAHHLKEVFLASARPSDYVRGAAHRLENMVAALDIHAVERVIEAIEQAGANGNRIFTVANGGSAAVASHFVNDMGVNSGVNGHRGYRVYCLTDNVSSVTAVANDVDFQSIFTRQLECNAERDDVVIAMSVSGNSENLVRALDYANRAGCVTVAFCGFDGGRLAQLAHHVVHVPSGTDEYGPVEDMFSVVCHLVSGYLTMRRGRFLHH